MTTLADELACIAHAYNEERERAQREKVAQAEAAADAIVAKLDQTVLDSAYNDILAKALHLAKQGEYFLSHTVELGGPFDLSNNLYGSLYYYKKYDASVKPFVESLRKLGMTVSYRLHWGNENPKDNHAFVTFDLGFYRERS